MMLETLITTYGYWAVLAGTAVEGETILILGGFAAHQGYLRLPLVILAAFSGSVAGDLFFFFLGRKRGKALLERYPGSRRRAERVIGLLERKYDVLLIGHRFVYGFRMVTPLVVGMSRMKAGRFMVLNGISAGLWSVAIGLCGYLFGHALDAVLSDLKRYELAVLAAVALVGTAAWLLRHWRKG